jgi:protein tyrosine phosphatase
MKVTLPDGTVVLAQGRLELIPSQRPRKPDFAVYLDERWHNDPEVVWPFRIIHWEDFGLPNDDTELFAAIADLHGRARAGELVEVACYGGIGRTGTVLSCLAVLAGVPCSAAMPWVRNHYHPSAVETPEQEQLIVRLLRH